MTLATELERLRVETRAPVVSYLLVQLVLQAMPPKVVAFIKALALALTWLRV